MLRRSTVCFFIFGIDRPTDRLNPSKPVPSAPGRDLFQRSRSTRPPPSSSSSGAGSTRRDRRTPSYAERAAGPIGTASSRAATPGVHLYANKEKAWESHTDDRFYGAKRMKDYWDRVMANQGTKYYLAGMVLLVAFAFAKLYQLQQNLMAEQGLIGPKKKPYRSRLTVVLDVDETIVSYGDKAFRMNAGLVPRPYLAELLDYLTSIDAEVILWAACTDRYMRQVLNVIDPSGIRVSSYITRNHQWFSSDNYYEKNIAWLKRPREDCLLIENRALSVRNCNGNAILVDDFIRSEYMDTGQDYPPNDHALRTLKAIIGDLERTGRPVPEYLRDRANRNREIQEIPCHEAIRQLPEEIARGVFYFIGDKYRPQSRAPLGAGPS